MPTIELTVPITNNSSQPRQVVIPKGTLIEADRAGDQNVAVAKEVTTSLGPGEQKSVAVEGYCVNQDLKYPSNATGKLTPYVLGQPFENQDQVWQTASRPDIGRNRAFKELRMMMRNHIPHHGRLEIIASDIGVLYDDLRGETVGEKCFFLIQHCLQQSLMADLLERLREEFPRSVFFTNWALTYLDDAA
jgi:hypothetical protein